MPDAKLATLRESLAQRAVTFVRGLAPRQTGNAHIQVASTTPEQVQALQRAWLGPGVPAPTTALDEATPRQWEYPIAWNLLYQPRSEQTELKFDMLRALADPKQGGLDLLRLVIETRKDQMSAQKWSIKARGDNRDDGGKRAREIEKQLRRPDGIKTYRQWQRCLVEEVLVTDAPVIYALPEEGVAELIDGATMKPLLGVDGRQPHPPDAAWMQVIRNIPVTYVDPEDGKKKPVSWTTDEIISPVRNPRVHAVYGMSPVEQILGILNLALARQSYMTAYFSAGNVPDAFVNGAQGWSNEQISAYQRYLDLLEGDVETRRKMRVIPYGATATLAKTPALKDDTDDYLLSLIAYALSVPRQALIKLMNRASAGQEADNASLEGLEPMKLWWKDAMDEVVEKVYEAEDLEYAYSDEEIADPVKKATVAKTLVDARIVSPKYIATEWYGFPDDAVPEDPPPMPGLLPGSTPGGGPIPGRKALPARAGGDVDVEGVVKKADAPASIASVRRAPVASSALWLGR